MKGTRICCIRKTALPALKKGKNILEAEIPFGKNTNTEWMYLLGDFGVEVCGRSVRVVPSKEKLAFGNIAAQGLPFYGGKHTLEITLYGHRRNGFGPVHPANLKETWIGPAAWRTEGEAWCYDYMICEEGIMTTPEIGETV